METTQIESQRMTQTINQSTITAGATSSRFRMWMDCVSLWATRTTRMPQTLLLNVRWTCGVSSCILIVAIRCASLKFEKAARHSGRQNGGASS